MKHIIAFALAFAPLVALGDEVRQVAGKGDLTLLTQAQQSWLSTFEGQAASPLDAAALDRSAASAREAKLASTADYLATCARFLRGEATVEDAERAMRRTLDEPLFVILRFDGAAISDILICTCDPAQTRALERSLEQFERSLPGFVESWLDRSPTRALTRIAKLHFRAGKNAAVASTGTYLPFDRTMTPAVGRTWIVYENMIRANWWGEGIRPVALRLLPLDSAKATPEAMVKWYGSRAPTYDIGPPVDHASLGAAKDPIAIIKGDLLPVLLNQSTDEQIASLTAVSFHTLRDILHGDAPPPHRPATTTEINWLVERGGLRFDDASVTWAIDFARARAAIQALATEILEIDRANDAARAEALLAKYGTSNAAIDKSVVTIDALARVKVQPVFVR